jgi:hypothetical protein
MICAFSLERARQRRYILAYPFMPFPAFADFKARLESEFGCSFKIGEDLCDGDGDSQPITYFEREVEGKRVQCVVSVADEQDPVATFLIRDVCKRLKIDPKEFGLDLG